VAKGAPKHSSIGYKIPPRHAQFKPGKSGNPSGRSKKKTITYADAIEKELDMEIRVVEGGKPRRITKRQAIAKQHTNKAVNGDLKAIALIIRAVNPKDSEQSDNLSPVLHALRAIHAKYEAASSDENR
jgi:hypothetical protein